MLILNLIFWTLVFLMASNVSSVVFSGQVDARIRQTLLDTLQRLHTASPPALETTINPTNDLARIPMGLNLLISQKYFDFRTLSSICITGKAVSLAQRAVVDDHLARISPYFVTSDPLVNNLLFSVLNEHFRPFSSLKTQALDSFKDDLLLLSMKFIQQEVAFDAIPINVYYYVICFLNEAAYGVNAQIPYSLLQCKVHFFHLVKKIGSKLPRCFEYLSKIQNLTAFETNHLAFFYESDAWPSKNEIKLHFNFHGEVSVAALELLNNIEVEYMLLLVESLITEVESIDLYPLIQHFVKYEIFSEVLWSCALSMPPTNDDFKLICCPINGINLFKYRKEAASKLRTSISLHNDKYSYGRNSLNLFENSRLYPTKRVSFCISFAKRLIENHNNGLAQLDTFYKLIRYGKIPVKELNKLLHETFLYSNAFMFDILVKESTDRLNIFYYNIYESFETVWSSNKSPDALYVKTFMELLDPHVENPLIFLTMDMRFLQLLKPRIIDRYDLNMEFAFDDLSFSDMTQFKLNPNKMVTFFGQVATFKEIINHFDMPGLKEIFSSNPTTAFSDNLQETGRKRGRPCSVSSYDHFFYFDRNGL